MRRIDCVTFLGKGTRGLDFCELSFKKNLLVIRCGKRVHQGCILSLCLFNFYAGYIIQNARLDEAQTGIKMARRNINNLR